MSRKAAEAKKSLGETASGARDRLSEASDAVSAAREAHGAEVIAAAKAGKEPPVNIALRAARQQEIDARDELEATESAIVTLNREEASHAYEASRAEKRVEEAARDVILRTLSDAQGSVREAQRELGRRVAACRYITSLLSYGNSFDDNAPKRAADNFLPRDIGDDIASMRAVEPWEAARLALLQDADAPLPPFRGEA